MEDSNNPSYSTVPLTLSQGSATIQDSPIHRLWRECGMTPVKIRPLFVPQSAALQGLIEEDIDDDEQQYLQHSSYNFASHDYNENNNDDENQDFGYSPESKIQHEEHEQHEEEDASKQEAPLYDIFGNEIIFPELSEFRITIQKQQDIRPPIIEDKQNDDPLAHLNTPSKALSKPALHSMHSIPSYTTNRKNNSGRSPLQDITPSVTKKQKKPELGTTAPKYSIFNTPRGLGDSGVADTVRLRMSRM